MTESVSKLIASESASSLEVKQWHNGQIKSAHDHVAEEVPVALIYNGVSHAVMLATPDDLEDFALGFSLSEGILYNSKELYSLDVIEQDNGIAVQMEIASERFVALKERRRNLAGRTGCGLCGTESLEHAVRLPAVQVTRQVFSMRQIQVGLENINQFQNLQKITGATHACALVSETGDVILVREDVGRHNALDKLVGAKAKLATCPNAFVITTSRASYEMVQKTAAAGISLLVAISAPTGLAVRLAEQCGMTLVGFARNMHCVIYAGEKNITHLGLDKDG